MKTILFILVMLTCLSSNGQSNRFVGERNEEVITIDSLNYKDSLKQSRFFYDLTNSKPYTGILVERYASFIDTMNVLNGYKNGYAYRYFVSNDTTLVEREVYNQKELYSLKRTRYLEKDFGKGYIVTFDNGQLLKYLLHYRKKKIIVKKYTVTGGKQKVKTSKYNGYESLRDAFSGVPFFSEMVSLNFFEKNP